MKKYSQSILYRARVKAEACDNRLLKIILPAMLLVLAYSIIAPSAYFNKPAIVRCSDIESPLQCQERLGEKYEVIYSPDTMMAWGEYKN